MQKAGKVKPWNFMNWASFPAESRKESALELDHAGIHGGFQRCPTWNHTCQMNIFMYRVSGKLDPGESFQSMSACLWEEFCPCGDAWGDEYKKWAIPSFPSPDLFLDDAEGKFHLC